MWRLAAILAAASALLTVPSAVAKDFHPGDLRVCGRDRCITLTNRQLLRVLSNFYWGAGHPAGAHRARLGAPGFELRFRDGYASGMVATTKLDRFRAYGVFCERFERGK